VDARDIGSLQVKREIIADIDICRTIVQTVEVTTMVSHGAQIRAIIIGRSTDFLVAIDAVKGRLVQVMKVDEVIVL